MTISCIDTTPLQLMEVQADNVHLVARPGVELSVESAGGDMLAARLDALGILVFGSTRQALSDSLEIAIAEVWKRFMDGDPACSVSEISGMRFQLISRFRPF